MSKRQKRLVGASTRFKLMAGILPGAVGWLPGFLAVPAQKPTSHLSATVSSVALFGLSNFTRLKISLKSSLIGITV
jgi:hypothetical protein